MAGKLIWREIHRRPIRGRVGRALYCYWSGAVYELVRAVPTRRMRGATESGLLPTVQDLTTGVALAAGCTTV